jgi:hypothetical protein
MGKEGATQRKCPRTPGETCNYRGVFHMSEKKLPETGKRITGEYKLNNSQIFTQSCE